jgi:hypothetical protein
LLHFILAASIVAAPSQVDKLEQYILRINPKAKQSKRIAKCIVKEAKRHKVPVEMLGAVAHTESHFRITAKGKWYEYGIYQLWAYAPYYHEAWSDYQQATYGKTGFPGVPWKKLGRKLQVKVSLDVCASAYMATTCVVVADRLPTAPVFTTQALRSHAPATYGQSGAE